MKYVVLILAFLSSMASASGGPEEVHLTPDLAQKLGFSISVSPEGSAIMIKLKGPKNNPAGCPASRSGTFLLGQSGEEILVHITELPVSNNNPEAVGYSTKHKMGIFIDYLCKGQKALESRRYTVPSINDWLITIQGSKGASRRDTLTRAPA